MHGDQHRMRHAMLFGEFEEPPRVEFGHDHNGTAVGQGRDQADQCGVGVSRRRYQRDRIGGIAGQSPAPDMVPAHPVALNDALRFAGSAGRIDNVEGISRRDVRPNRPVSVRSHPVLQKRVGRARANSDQPDRTMRQLRRSPPVREQQVSTRIPHHAQCGVRAG